MYSKAGVAPLSEHQVRRLIKGQGVSIKAGSKHAIPMSKEQMKKFERAKKAGRGMVITLDPYQQSMCGSGFEEMMRDSGRYLQPTFDAAQDRAMRELRGGGAEEMFRDTGRYLQPTFDAAQDRAIREIQGRGFAEDMRQKYTEKYKNEKFYDSDGNLIRVKGGRVRGKGFFDDVGRSFQQTFSPDLGRQIASELIHKGLPIAGSTLGGIGGTFATGGPLGGMAGSYAGERLGEELARETGRQTGYGVGKGLMTDAFAMAKSHGKRVAKDALGKAKMKAKELVNQYLDLGEKEAMDLIGSGSFGGYKKKMGGAMRKRLRGKALLVA